MITRRDFLRTVAGVSGLSIGACVGKPGSIEILKHPNLLIIHTDEHNFRTLGCYRKLMPPDQAFIWGMGIKVDTPNIDWLADNGAICTSFYANTPVCSPSRASFVSGRYPQNTPVIVNNVPMDDEIITFAEILARKGYATGYAGKWHLDGTGKPQWTPKRRFGFEDNLYMFNRGHWKQLEDTPDGPRIAARDQKGKPSYSIKGANEKNFTTDFLAQKTIEFIKAHKNKPFCYMVSIPDPHGPNSVRAPYDTMYKELDFQKPRTATKDAKNLPSWAKKAKKTIGPKAMSQYFGMVKCIDDNVGKILNYLRTQGLFDNTIIVFTSDHGDLCGEHSRDNKGVPFEASAKVPFILYYPKKVKAGTVIKETLSCVDFLPTVLAMMKIPTAQTEQGRDASAIFTTGRTPKSWNDITFIRGTGHISGKDDNNWLAAVTKRHKLVYSPGDDPWLFDLQKDPDELTNFYNNPDYKETAQKLAKQLIEYSQKYNDPRIEQKDIKKQLNKLLS